MIISQTTFVGAKGGVGTTTVAVIHALNEAAAGRTVRLSATTAAGVEDLADLLAVQPPGPGGVVPVTANLTLAHGCDPTLTNVLDAGTDSFSDHDGMVYMVLRNDYCSLRRAIAAPQTTVGAVLIVEPERDLQRRDVEAVLGYPVVAQVAISLSVARASDAGLLCRTRRPRLMIPTPAVPR